MSAQDRPATKLFVGDGLVRSHHSGEVVVSAAPGGHYSGEVVVSDQQFPAYPAAAPRACRDRASRSGKPARGPAESLSAVEIGHSWQHLETFGERSARRARHQLADHRLSRARRIRAPACIWRCESPGTSRSRSRSCSPRTRFRASAAPRPASSARPERSAKEPYGIVQSAK